MPRSTARIPSRPVARKSAIVAEQKVHRAASRGPRRRRRRRAAGGGLLCCAFWRNSPSWGGVAATVRLDALLRRALLAEMELLDGSSSTICISLHDAVALLAIVAQHQATPSAHVRRRSQMAVLEQQHPIGPRGERPVVRHDDHRDLEVPSQLGEQLVQPLGVARGRDCPTARRRTRPPGRSPAHGRPRSAAARRPTAPPAGGACARSARRAPAAPRARLRAARVRTPAMRSGIITFSSAENSRSRWWNWNTNPTVRLRSAASCVVRRARRSDAPAITTSPRVGRSSAPSTCSSVLLPAPLAPTIGDHLAAATRERHAREHGSTFAVATAVRLPQIARFDHASIVGSSSAITRGGSPRSGTGVPPASTDRASRASRSRRLATTVSTTSSGCVVHRQVVDEVYLRIERDELEPVEQRRRRPGRWPGRAPCRRRRSPLPGRRRSGESTRRGMPIALRIPISRVLSVTTMVSVLTMLNAATMHDEQQDEAHRPASRA